MERRFQRRPGIPTSLARRFRDVMPAGDTRCAVCGGWFIHDAEEQFRMGSDPGSPEVCGRCVLGHPPRVESVWTHRAGWDQPVRAIPVESRSAE